MNWWIFAGIYLLVGLLYLVIGTVVIFVHYSRIFGLEKTAEAVELLTEQWETSWLIAPINMILWPWRFTSGLIESVKGLHEILYSENKIGEGA